MSMNQYQEYEIMHGEQKVASVSRNGLCQIYEERMLPYNLYLEQGAEDDIDMRLQNLENFYHWCASRVLTLDREYAKEILNSIGVSQAVTDKDRAQIALSYHCLSLMDIYWVRELEEACEFSLINLYENHLATAFVDVSLRGKQMTIENRLLIAGDLSTQGQYPKAWIREAGEFWLLKDGGEETVDRELLASKISRCFRVNQVLYESAMYDGQKVSKSKIITTRQRSIVPMEYFEIYAMNHEFEKMEYILRIDGYSYHMMNIVDYLIGNTDRHWGNWGILVDNETNEPIRLYDLMDFNRAFHSYDTIDGANCLTTINRQSQMQAAIEAVKAVGLNQITEIQPEWFVDDDVREMFFKRLEILKAVEAC